MVNTRLLVFFLLASSNKVVIADEIENEDSACFCAVMNNTNSEPLLERILEANLGCDDEGSTKCRELCAALAEVTREAGNGAHIFCQQLEENVKNVMINVNSKVCNDSYISTGLAYKNPICCKDGTAEDCY